ncbi:MAG: DUF4276 family protein [Rikenellaceae bacterium]
MKRLYIIVEGHTEQYFINNVLRPYLNRFNIYAVTPILVNTSKTGKGGLSNYEHLRNNITAILKQEQGDDIVVTTMIDFFKIPTSTPSYIASMAIQTKKGQVSNFESAIDRDINDRRFFSYIQIHEFEALLFANNRGFEELYSDEVSSQTGSIVSDYSNPEDINSSPQSAPSKRILSIVKKYNKKVDGSIIALEVGIDDMLKRCPHFREWVEQLINRAN